MSTSGEAPDVINIGLEAVHMAVSNDFLCRWMKLYLGIRRFQK